MIDPRLRPHIMTLGVALLALVALALVLVVASGGGAPWAEAQSRDVPPQPMVTSHAASVHGADLWNAAGFTGAGVKVGIIDTGFKGFPSLMGGELPATVVGRCYVAVGVFTSNLSDCELGEDKRGTALAEAVMDTAPRVTLYIANPQSYSDLQATASWMTSQGVKVINHSVGWI